MRGTQDENTKEEIDFREQENILPFEKYDMYKASQGQNTNLAGSSYNGFILKSDQDPNVSINLENAKDLIENYWYALALCHSCSVQVNEDGVEEYICVSPDSIELVKTAKAQGFHLTKNENASIKKIILGGDENNIAEVELLQLIEFSSDRKRETVIVKDRGVIKLYCKGADSIIKARTSPNTPQQILKQGEYYVDKFSKQGFRTLFVSMKVLSQSEYDSFAQEVKQASTSLDNKDELLAQAYEKVENNLYIIGATIVEDKLQENVPETIRDLRLANIKIWMLTGDKMDTAENIAKSCNLINEEVTLFRLCGNENSGFEDAITSVTDFQLRFREFKGRYNSMEQPGKFAILIDEKMLAKILPGEKPEPKQSLSKKISTVVKSTISTLRSQELEGRQGDESGAEDDEKLFMDIAKDAASVICCRVSPSQKSKVVLMMKRFYPSAVTLAIGDGGNDVPMIMEAHIGVGIYGEEGMRAVQSSDYAIGEFQFLRSLLLFHGRTNYIRNAECVMYFFYKNFSFTLCQFVFGFYCNFTGQTIVDDWFISSYNLLFTSLPLGARALLDHDIKPSDGVVVDKMLPFLYAENRDNPIFTIPKFFLNLLRGAVHCMINYFFVIYLYQYGSVNKHGKMGGLWFISVNLFTSVLIVVTVDLFIYTRYHTWINFTIILVFTIIAYIVFIIAAHNVALFKSVGTMAVAFGSPRFWMSIIFVCGTCALIDYFILGFDFLFRITLGKILQILFSQRGELNDEYNLPKCIGDRINRYKTFEQQKVHNENDVYKIPQNTANFPEDTKPEDNYVGIKNISINKKANDDQVGIKNITVNNQPNDGYNRIKKITVNNGKNNNVYRNSIDNMTLNSNQFFNVTNSNMNINTNTQLFNNQEDDMDIFPNYQRPSLGIGNDLAQEFNNYQAH
jgi:phospholipid-transporting ATPase